MERKQSVGKWVALGCGGLIVLLVVLSLAGYAILRAVGGRRGQSALERLKASGAPTTWEEVIPAPVPDEQNAALLYEDAFALLTLPKSSGRALMDYLSAANRQERRVLEKQVAQIVADNAEVLAYARKAAKRPKCRFDRDWRNPVTMSMPELPKFKDLSRLACAQALLRADRGDVSAALEAWSLNLSIADHLGSDPLLLGQLTRIAVIAIADQSLPRILQSGRPSPEQCWSLAQALGKLDLSEGFLKSCEAERAGNLWIVEQAWEDPASPGAPLRHLGFLARLDRAAMLEFWEKQMALVRKPYRETAGQFDALEDEIPRYALHTRSFAFTVEGGVMARDRALALVGLMRTGLGLAAYRTRHGEYPEPLDELRKALNWEVPEDPFSGEDLVYRREGKGYLLYSLDRDLDDDGGKPFKYFSGSRTFDGDIAWRVEQ